MSMKVAIFSPYATVVPHFETELDIAQQHLDLGDEVVFLNCTGSLSNCDFNPSGDRERCAQCTGRRSMGLALLQPSATVEKLESVDGPNLPRFQTIEELTQFCVEDFDIGWAILSSLVSICRDPEPDLDQNWPLLNRFYQSALSTYRHTIRFLKSNPIDRVYVFNGRFASMRAVLRACQKQKTDCWIHERGCDGEHFELMKNHLPHDLIKIEKAICGQWESARSSRIRETVARQWFHDRVNRVEKVWHSFVKDQESGRLPQGFDPSEKNVSIFCSSDDEFVAIGDSWTNKLYQNQVEAISQIAQSMLTRQPNTRIYLRVHPNLRNTENRRKQRMLGLDFANLSI
ncbi:MAG: hypothetical protein AAF623_19695, partial [Planctomycetota bacterium]